MAELTWDGTGNRFFETGVSKGVLFIPDAQGDYTNGVAWNGLTTVTESPSGAESSSQYADNMEYLNLTGVEKFGATIEAYTYPDEFAQFDGFAEPEPGVFIGQQNRKAFGVSYQTRVGNDVEGSDLGYKIHLVYGAKAAPSERAYATINETPEAMTFSWELTTSAVAVGTVGGVEYKPTASLTIDSTKVDPAALATLEATLYGSASVEPEMPLPADVIALFSAP